MSYSCFLSFWRKKDRGDTYVCGGATRNEFLANSVYAGGQHEPYRYLNAVARSSHTA